MGNVKDAKDKLIGFKSTVFHPLTHVGGIHSPRFHHEALALAALFTTLTTIDSRSWLSLEIFPSKAISNSRF